MDMKQVGNYYCLALLSLISGCTNSATNDMYLIPEGYEGYILAVYNVKGAPPLTYENDFAVHAINEMGYFVTSHHDLDYGTVTDEYYYMDSEGNRTKVDDQCIRGIGTGGHERSDHHGNLINIVYSGIEITSDCTSDFSTSSNGMESDMVNPVISHILEEYYEWVDPAGEGT